MIPRSLASVRQVNSFIPIHRQIVTMTQSEFENLNTTPKTLVPAIPGCIIRPAFSLFQVTIATVYGGALNITIVPSGLTAVSWCGNLSPVPTATGLKTVFGGLITGGSLGTSMVNRALVAFGSANIAGGSITGPATMILDYTIVPGLL